MIKQRMNHCLYKWFSLLLSSRYGHCSTGQPAKLGERKESGNRLLLKPLKIQNIVKNIFSTKQDEKLSRQTLLFWLFFWKCSGTNAGGKTTKLSNPTHGLSHRTTSPSPHCRTRAAAVYGRWSAVVSCFLRLKPNRPPTGDPPQHPFWFPVNFFSYCFQLSCQLCVYISTHYMWPCFVFLEEI